MDTLWAQGGIVYDWSTPSRTAILSNSFSRSAALGTSQVRSARASLSRAKPLLACVVDTTSSSTNFLSSSDMAFLEVESFGKAAVTARFTTSCPKAGAASSRTHFVASVKS